MATDSIPALVLRDAILWIAPQSMRIFQQWAFARAAVL
jgi:hypothetical protein